MIESLTPHSIASTVRLLRDAHAGAIAVFEGDTDIRLFSKFLDETVCVPINAHNKDNALGVLEILDAEGVTGVLVIVDADYWRLEGVGPPSPNAFASDEHDLEVTIFKSPALEHVLAEYGSPAKIGSFAATTATTIRGAVLAVVVPIGCLRWASLRSGLNLRFEGLVFSRFVQLRAPMALDRPRFIKTVLAKSHRLDLSVDQVANLMAARENVAADSWQVVCGHDLCCVLSLALRTLLGSNNANEVRPEVIELSLRLAYQEPHFRATALYRSIEHWEQATGYRVFTQQ
jgi:hypothetical protein